MKHYYFMDDNIYFMNKKQPPRKTELFHINIDMGTKIYTGYDKDGNYYRLHLDNYPLIIEED